MLRVCEHCNSVISFEEYEIIHTPDMAPYVVCPECDNLIPVF